MSNHPFPVAAAPALPLLEDFDTVAESLFPELSTAPWPPPAHQLASPVPETLWAETAAIAEPLSHRPWLDNLGTALPAPVSGANTGTETGAIVDPLFNDTTIEQVWSATQQTLAAFWQTSDRQDALALAFGAEKATPATASLVQQLIAGDIVPKLQVLPQAELQAQGAYAAASNTIFLAKELFGQPEQLLRVVLEEIGHFLDDHSGPVDAPGDEGDLFAAQVLGEDLTAAAIAAIKAEDDSGTLLVEGQFLAIEKADSGPGTFTVDPAGTVAAEFLADSGAYTGQLAIFSLTGMEALAPGSSAFIQEAARRALSSSTEGYVIINDIAEAASLNGELGEKNRNAGTPAGIKTFAFEPGTHIAVMLVPNGSVQAVFDNPAADGTLRPLFSLPTANPGSRVHLGEIRPGVFAMEDQRFDGGSDADFNDVIFRLQGATGQIESITNLVGNQQIWVNTPLGQQLFLISDEALGDPTAQPVFVASDNPVLPPVDAANLQVSIPASGVPQFNANNTEAEIAASGAARITIGTQTIYIGTNQVSGNNQNPIVASFDSANPANNWIRTDYEVTGADGRGVGLAWDGTSLYGVFTVDGTQGSAAEDFRRAAADAQQAWLRSYGQGGGPKVSVLARIDATTGELLDAAYLSAVLGNGNSNTLTIEDINVNATGHLVISAQSFFRPRRPDGTALTETATAGSSPFAYTVEITPDLKQVKSTSAVGFV